MSQDADLFINKIETTMLQQGVLHAGDGIVLGVSGGADSVCLLLLLAELRELYDLKLFVLHVHHGIRGAEADADAAFVEELCEAYSVPCRVARVDIPALAAERHCSKEEMGRKERYRLFEEYREEKHAQWIAVAHNLEDNAETLLWNLCRGSGRAGLVGMRPVRGRIIRPLLKVSRTEIEMYLKRKGQNFRIDRTNQTVDYTRNRIRHQILPLLSEHVNSQAVLHIAESAERMAAISDYLEAQITAEREKMQEKNGLVWRNEDYECCPAALRAEVLLACLKQVSRQQQDFTAEHLHAIQELFSKEVGKQVHLPYGVQARRTYEGVCIEKPETGEKQKQTDEEYALSPDETLQEITLPDGAWIQYRLQEFHAEENREEFIKIMENGCTKCFDYDKIHHNLVLRTRKTGDRLVMHPDGRTKKLKDYWIDQKVPREERDSKWLLAEGSYLLWILGERTGENYRIDKDTKKVLIVQWEKEKGKRYGR